MIVRNNSVAAVLIGDCLASMRHLSSKSVQMCVTSPPYFGLRDYGNDGRIGLEQTPDEYVSKLVEVFREVRRVLRDDGTLWLNLGDSYARNASKGKSGTPNGRNLAEQGYGGGAGVPAGLKEKDLIGIPWMVAFALRADGWYLRQGIIWHKPNPMPESVTDRFTKAHEDIFLLTKSPRYRFDHEAVREEAVKGAAGSSFNKGKTADHQMRRSSEAVRVEDGKRNRRSVWNIATRPYPGSHFAVFPPALIEPCILAGSRPGDTVLDPFGGSGTTGGVALKHGRHAMLCELSPEYAELMPDRIDSIVNSK